MTTVRGQHVISTEDSTWGLENCPKSYFKYTADETAQSRTTTSTKLRIKSANRRQQFMAQARSRLANRKDMRPVPQLTPVQQAFPNPFPRAGDNLSTELPASVPSASLPPLPAGASITDA